MTEPTKFTFKFNNPKGEEQDIPLSPGDIIFILGANGSGKSSLIHRIFTKNRGVAKRISAHRQTWFTSNTSNYTAATKLQTSKSIFSHDMQITARWKDDNAAQRSQITIYDLINAENIRARTITKAMDQKDIPGAERIRDEIEPPIDVLNKLLNISNIPIKLFMDDEEQIYAKRNGCVPYSISELSDGERNALLIISDILTAKPKTLFLIDEPERHLHRSIISPLLTSILQKRPDCAFIIGTHEINLPIDHPKSKVLLLREIIWENSNPTSWDADLLSSTEIIDNRVIRDILGSRRTILFIEGTQNSLDKQIYNILFSNISIIPQGSCTEVQQSVQGIANTESLHWVKAFGIIDLDDRNSDDVESLKEHNIYALPCYSVESLYYSANMIRHIARKQATTTGRDAKVYEAKALQDAKDAIIKEKDNLCARLCEKRFRSKITLPGWKDIILKKKWTLDYDTNSVLDDEIKLFESFVTKQKIDELIRRYPVNKTEALEKIARALDFKDCKVYEDTVRKLLIDDEVVCKETSDSLGELTTAILNADSI